MKTIMVLLFVRNLLTLLLMTQLLWVRAYNPPSSMLFIDSVNGKVLVADAASETRHPASLTKIITLMVVFDEIYAGRLDLDDRFSLSRKARGQSPTKLGLGQGERITVKQAIQSIIVMSANDVSVGIAEYISGSESNFVKRMNAKARQIGMLNSNFENSTGLPNRRQVTTARDMIKAIQYLQKRYHNFYPFFNQVSFSYKGKSYRNHNKLVGTYQGVTGLKTGFINASGFNIAITANKNGRAIAGVIFGSRSSQERTQTATATLNRIFYSYRQESANNLRRIIQTSYNPRLSTSNSNWNRNS